MRVDLDGKWSRIFWMLGSDVMIRCLIWSMYRPCSKSLRIAKSILPLASILRVFVACDVCGHAFYICRFDVNTLWTSSSAESFKRVIAANYINRITSLNSGCRRSVQILVVYLRLCGVQGMCVQYPKQNPGNAFETKIKCLEYSECQLFLGSAVCQW